MAGEYQSLDELLSADAGARAFFSALPQYLKDQMHERNQSINSFESLRHYVDNLVQE